nr:MAG TPA: hypothetical protein [Caudoviricetes sp.]
MPNYSAVLLKRVSEVRILFGTPYKNTAILMSCGVFVCQNSFTCSYSVQAPQTSRPSS